MIGRRAFVAATGVTLLAHRALAAAHCKGLDVALVNGKFWTGVPGAPVAAAIGIVGDRIGAVGDQQVRSRITRQTQVIDLAGAFGMPAFTDTPTLGAPGLLHAASGSADLRRNPCRQGNYPGCLASTATLAHAEPTTGVRRRMHGEAFL